MVHALILRIPTSLITEHDTHTSSRNLHLAVYSIKGSNVWIIHYWQQANWASLICIHWAMLTGWYCEAVHQHTFSKCLHYNFYTSTALILIYYSHNSNVVTLPHYKYTAESATICLFYFNKYSPHDKQVLNKACIYHWALHFMQFSSLLSGKPGTKKNPLWHVAWTPNFVW